jgi:hypothetical protein
MWLLTPDGFYSVVQKHGEENLCVRARVGTDLDRLRDHYLPSLTETMETPGGDYRYRAWATHDEVGHALAAIAGDVHYDNFKTEVARHDHERARTYHDVWEVLGRLQPGGPYGFSKKAEH